MGSALELTVKRAVADGWPVEAEWHRPGELSTRAAGVLQLRREPVGATPRAYGEALGQALFTEPIRGLFVSARRKGPVSIWLCIEDDALRTWRWEWLCAPTDGGGWDFLSLNERTPYSRYLPSLTSRDYPPIGRQHLRALVLVASPADPDQRYGLASFDHPAAVARLHAVFDRYHLPSRVLARAPGAVGAPTLDALAAQLTDGATILHVVCHGRFDPVSEKTWLYLEQPHAGSDGSVRSQPVDADMLIGRLAQAARLPHLIFLSVCESSAPEAEQRFGGLAQRLVRELGVPAVIGMTERVSMATAFALSDAFYDRLLQMDNGTVDQALVEAFAPLASRLDVHVPALYSRLGHMPLFSPADKRALTGAELRAGLDRLEELLSRRAPVLKPELAKLEQSLNPLLSCVDRKDLREEVREECEASLRRIEEISLEAVDVPFLAVVDGRRIPEYNDTQPFLGMLPFQAKHHHLFFGRDALIDKLERKLAEDRFLPVLGPSGSGKSSLVLAGLVPRLEAKHPDLQVKVFTPGAAPLSKLHAVQAQLRDGPALYVIDQFEEVFTESRDEQQRRGFIDELLALTKRQLVVLTMRADFWGECALYRQLRERMQARQELIPPMTTSELRFAIDQQKGEVGLLFEADLAQTMLDEVAGEPGAMPLLQHALLELWKRRHGRMLTTREYRTIGGVKKAIAETADRLYQESSVSKRIYMRNIFLRLTKPDEQNRLGEERRDARRRVAVADLVPKGDDPGPINELVQQLADKVLVTTSDNSLTGLREVEVAHEALIRHWARLRKWLNEHHEDQAFWRSVTEAATDWRKQPDDPDVLLHRGSKLERAEQLQKDLQSNKIEGILKPNETEVAYLAACRAGEDAALRRLLLAVAVLGVLTVALVVTVVFLVDAYKEARSRAWTGEAIASRKSPDRSLQLAAKALTSATDGSPAHLYAMGALWEVLGRTGGTPLAYGKGLIAASLSDDGRYAALGGVDMDGNGGLIVHDRRTGEKRSIKPNAGAFSWLRFVPRTHIAVVGDGGHVGLSIVCSMDLDRGFSTAPLVCDAGEDDATALSLDPTGRWLLVGRMSGQVDLYSLPSLDLSSAPAFSFPAQNGPVSSAAFSEDGTWLATGAADGTLRLWNMRGGTPSLAAEHQLPEGRVSAIAFYAKYKMLMAATGYKMKKDGFTFSQDQKHSKIRMWSLPASSLTKPDEVYPTTLGETTDIVAAGALVAVLGTDPDHNRLDWPWWWQVKKFHLGLTNGPRLSLSPIESAPAHSATLLTSPAGQWLAVTFADGQVELRPVDCPRTLMLADCPRTTVRFQAHKGAAWSVGAAGSMFITAGQDGRARLWAFDGESAVVGHPIPFPLPEWQAADLHFTGANKLLVAYNSAIKEWTLRADGRLTASPDDIPASKIIAGKNGKVYFCHNNDPCMQAVDSHEERLERLPGRIEDTHKNGLILVGSHQGLQLCWNHNSQIRCGDKLGVNADKATFTADGKAVLAASSIIKCPASTQCAQYNATHLTWIRVEGGRLVEGHSVERPYRVIYHDADWVVLARRSLWSPESPEDGEIYRLRDGGELKPYRRLLLDHIRRSSILDHTTLGLLPPNPDALLKEGRWLLLNNWIGTSNKLIVLDLTASPNALALPPILLSENISSSMASSGHHAFVGLRTGVVAIVDLRSPKLIREVPGHDAAVTAIAVNEARRLMVTGDASGRLRLWDLQTPESPEPMPALSLFSTRINRLVFSPDGRWLGVAVEKEAPRVYSLDSAVLTKLVDALAPREPKHIGSADP